MRDQGGKAGGKTLDERAWDGSDSSAPIPGRQSLVQLSVAPAEASPEPHPAPAAPSGPAPQLPSYASIQRMFGGPEARGGGAPDVHAAAAQGISGSAGQLPHLEQIQKSFGRHDVGHVQAHTGSEAAAGAKAMGADAFATGDHVAFAGAPSLHLAAHEAAHVVQQRGGVQLAGGVGRTGDAYEQHADQVADLVVQGKSAEALLDRHAGGGGGAVQASAIQRFDSYEHAAIGNDANKAVGGGGIAVSAEESSRRTAEQQDHKFDAGQRSISVELRQRNPTNNMPVGDGKKTAVALSYGEMVALSGDVYASVDHLKMAPAEEVTKLRDLVRDQGVNPAAKNFDVEFERATAWRRAGIYQPGTGTKEGAKGEYWGVGGDSYLDLARTNNAHFSAATGSTAVPAGPEGNAAADNHQGWLTDHSRAIALARKAREAKKQELNSTTAPGAAAPGGAAKADTPNAHDTPPKPAPAPAAPGANYRELENEAYLYNAGGDHYLTDAFSSGHLFNKSALSPVTDRVLDNKTFEKLIDDMTVFADKEHPYVPHFIVRRKVASGLAVFKTDAALRHNVGAKLVHDYLNEHGAIVKSRNGKFSWTTKGDTFMDAVTKDMASRAVLASRNHIRALVNADDADLAKPENADDAWDYTPNVDASAFAAQCEPFLRAQLSQSAKLWELMQSAVQAQDDLEKEKKTEENTAKDAKQDKDGDWGPQPGGTRFTKRMITTEGAVVTK